MKSKTRKIIDKWVKQNLDKRAPHYIGQGYVYIFPSSNVKDQHYLVVQLDVEAGTYVCSCRGFWFSADDVCRHVKQLDEEVQAALPLARGEA